MEFGTVFFYLFSALLIFQGVFSLIKGYQPFAGQSEIKSREKYTPESYSKANKVFAVCIIVGALCFLVYQLNKSFAWFDFPALVFVGFGVLVVGVVLYYVLLKKKDSDASGNNNGRYFGNSNGNADSNSAGHKNKDDISGYGD